MTMEISKSAISTHQKLLKRQQLKLDIFTPQVGGSMNAKTIDLATSSYDHQQQTASLKKRLNTRQAQI